MIVKYEVDKYKLEIDRREYTRETANYVYLKRSRRTQKGRSETKERKTPFMFDTWAEARLFLLKYIQHAVNRDQQSLRRFLEAEKRILAMEDPTRG